MYFRNMRNQKKVLAGASAIVITTIVALVFVSIVLAVPPDETLEFRGGEIGKIVFSGKKHAEEGFECDFCHSGIFEMQKGSVYIKFKDHLEGNYCFMCHTPQGNCYNCHKK